MEDIIQESRTLDELCSQEPPQNAKIMRTKIFPRVAMYQILQKIMSKKSAYDMVWDYTKTCICAPVRQQYAKIERVPFFFFLFRKMFLYIMLHSEAWSVNVVQNDSKRLVLTVHRCLWKDTCLACGCPELCRIFCDSDWENFGAMRSVSFRRTQTIGTGGTVCDFVFEASQK